MAPTGYKLRAVNGRQLTMLGLSWSRTASCCPVCTPSSFFFSIWSLRSYTLLQQYCESMPDAPQSEERSANVEG